MSVKCPHPNCGQVVDKQEDGTYPSRCPHCGLLLQPASKPRRARTAPANPPVRKPAPTKATNTAAAQADDDPFGIHSKQSPASSSNPFGAPEPSAPPVKTKAVKPTKPAAKPAAAPISDLPIGGTPSTVRRPYENRTDYSKWIFLTILLAAAGGGGYYLYKYTDLLKIGGAGGPAATFANPAENYSLNLPNLLWQRDEATEKQEKVDLYFEREAGEDRAWITVKSGEARSRLSSVGGATDALMAAWKEQMASVEFGEQSEATLAGRPANRVTATGDLYGIQVQREAYVMVEQGLWYQLTLTAKAGSFDKYVGDFNAVRDSFKILGERPGWQQLATGPTRDFTGMKAPYLIQAAPEDWKENPQLRAESRYSDLKLVGKEYSNIVVVPRETSIELDKMVENYMRFKRRRFDGADQVVEKHREPSVTVNGLPAFQLELLVKKVDGEVFQLVTFIKEGKYIYIVECEAPIENAAAMRPKFTQITNSFQVLDAIVERKQMKPPVAIAQATPTPLPATMSSSSDSSEPPATANASSTSGTGTGAVMELPDREFPSLDDLDFETAAVTPVATPMPETASTKPAEPEKPSEKPNDEPKTEKKEESDDAKKKRRSLDDL